MRDDFILQHQRFKRQKPASISQLLRRSFLTALSTPTVTGRGRQTIAFYHRTHQQKPKMPSALQVKKWERGAKPYLVVYEHSRGGAPGTLILQPSGACSTEASGGGACRRIEDILCVLPILVGGSWRGLTHGPHCYHELIGCDTLSDRRRQSLILHSRKEWGREATIYTNFMPPTFLIRIMWKKKSSPRGTHASNDTAVHIACKVEQNVVSSSSLQI